MATAESKTEVAAASEEPRVEIATVWFGIDHPAPEGVPRMRLCMQQMRRAAGLPVRVWGRDECHELVRNHYPQYHTMFAEAAQPVMQFDLVRYMLMHHVCAGCAKGPPDLAGDPRRVRAPPRAPAPATLTVRRPLLDRARCRQPRRQPLPRCHTHPRQHGTSHPPPPRRDLARSTARVDSSGIRKVIKEETRETVRSRSRNHMTLSGQLPSKRSKPSILQERANFVSQRDLGNKSALVEKTENPACGFIAAPSPFSLFPAILTLLQFFRQRAPPMVDLPCPT